MRTNFDPPSPAPACGSAAADSTSGPAAFASMPGHLLRRCQQIAVGIFLDECRDYELTPLQFAALATLARHGPSDQAGLGRRAALDRTTAALVLRKLQERGLVERLVGGRDRRSKHVGLSPAGEALLAAVTESVERTQQRILAPLAPHEQELLLQLLARLADANNTQSRAPLREA